MDQRAAALCGHMDLFFWRCHSASRKDLTTVKRALVTLIMVGSIATYRANSCWWGLPTWTLQSDTEALCRLRRSGGLRNGIAKKQIHMPA